MVPGRPKLGLGGSPDLQNWILDGLERVVEGSGLAWTAILGVQGTVWTPSWGHLGAPGSVSGAILEDLGFPNGSGELFSNAFFMILEVWGHWKSIKMG